MIVLKLSIVVPVYGCPEALNELHSRLTDSVRRITDDYEIVLVNDACPKNSWEIISEICVKDKKVKGIELSRNFGQMKAILAGLEYATGDWIVVMDCDLQDRPEEIERLYEKSKEGYDAVFARRFNRQDKKTKIFLAKLFYKVYSYATDVDYDGAICNFSIINRAVVNAFLQMRDQHRGYAMYIKWLGFKQAIVDVEHNDRYAGESSYSLKKRVDLAVELLTSQSDKLLKFFVKIGFATTVISVFAIIALVISHFTRNVTIGWTSLIAVNILIGGILMCMIGVVGIYVGNTFMQTKGRPLYIVRSVLNENS